MLLGYPSGSACHLPDRTQPPVVKRPVGIAIELLARIPSIILRHVGSFRLRRRFLQVHVQPPVIDAVAGIRSWRTCSPVRRSVLASHRRHRPCDHDPARSSRPSPRCLRQRTSCVEKAAYGWQHALEVLWNVRLRISNRRDRCRDARARTPRRPRPHGDHVIVGNAHKDSARCSHPARRSPRRMPMSSRSHHGIHVRALNRTRLDPIAIDLCRSSRRSLHALCAKRGLGR